MDASPQPPTPLPPPGAEPYGPPCPGCARRRTEADATGVLWSTLHAADGTVRFLCPDCTRAQLAEIEAGLPPVPPAAAPRRRPAA